MKCKITKECVGYVRGKRQTRHPGDIVEHKDAWRLVKAGLAEPADQECATKSGRDLVARQPAPSTPVAETKEPKK